MKKFLGFLVDLFVIVLELAICAFIVFYLISHPIVERVIVNNVTTTRSPDSSDLSYSSHSPNVLPGSKRSITARPAKAARDIPPVIWIPEQLVPEKQWGYDRVYSCTSLERAPGFWYIPGSQPPLSPHFPGYTFDENPMLCF
ncbi:MAG: hypothetical protein RBT80_05070 [Candidatus Vecturithrix sp.]|jgi:hypothetical protein|nr:hypothetical protein [Candidatus Vecturithrix sp.]